MLIIYIARVHILDNPVFGPPTVKYDPDVEWERYLTRRQERNIIKMNLSYNELMAKGSEYSETGRWRRAERYFYHAKTLFPDRMYPRTSLCYTYLQRCQDDTRFCSYAKREIYYAWQYLDHAEPSQEAYIRDLASLVEMGDLLDKPEKEALEAIF
ncbi:MAG: hypothetical protein AAFQ02_10995 [Bacteroidota bacterium]